MKIIEVINLTEIKPLKEIAKDEAKHLPSFEKKMRVIFKEIGVVPKGTGKSGWDIENADSSKLQLPVESFEIFQPRAAKLHKANQKINKPENKQTKKEENKQTKKEEIHDKILLDNNPTRKEESKVLRKVTYEIEEWLHDELKVKAIREKRKVSEIVNEMIKKGLE